MSEYSLESLLIPRIEHHLSSFKYGFLNIFSRQNLLRSLSRLLFLLLWNKYGAKKCLKNHIPFGFWDDSNLANQGAGKTIEKPLKELPRNQQVLDKRYHSRSASQSLTYDSWKLPARHSSALTSYKATNYISLDPHNLDLYLTPHLWKSVTNWLSYLP